MASSAPPVSRERIAIPKATGSSRAPVRKLVPIERVLIECKARGAASSDLPAGNR